MIIVLTLLAGGVGAVARFVVDAWVRAKVAIVLPLGTMIINVTGSFLLGLIAGLTAAAVAPESLRLVLGTGFLGGYTTFSTASFETVRLVQDRRLDLALLNGLGTLVVAVAAATFGYALTLI